jgi:hypothetical protein
METEESAGTAAASPPAGPALIAPEDVERELNKLSAQALKAKVHATATIERINHARTHSHARSLLCSCAATQQGMTRSRRTWRRSRRVSASLRRRCVPARELHNVLAINAHTRLQAQDGKGGKGGKGGPREVVVISGLDEHGRMR